MCVRWGVKGREDARRATFLIDGEGRIVHVWDPVVVDGHVAAVLAELENVPG